MIYLDSASTYHPKSPRIPGAVAGYLADVVSSPGRGSHRQGRLAADSLTELQLLCAQLFNAERAEDFHFCANATHGLNFVIQGLLEPGDHVITTALEHNSVLRPLKKMSVERGVEVTVVPCDSEGRLDANDVIRAATPRTKLVVVNHASNVVGTVSPIARIVQAFHERSVRTLVDASQTAGLLSIDLSACPIDYLVATGHKALRGPSGTGILYARSIEGIKPLLVGGTGGNSLSLWHPLNSHAIFEAGTPNYLGLAGLKVAIEDVMASSSPLGREIALARQLAEGLQRVEGVRVYGPKSWDERVPLVSFNITRLSPQQVLGFLDDEYGIIVRAGLHCAPIVHQRLGTAPAGTVRASLSHATLPSEIGFLIAAVADIASRHRHAALALDAV